MLKKSLWIISFILTGIFVCLTTLHVYQASQYHDLNSAQVATPKDFTNYLNNYYKKYPLKPQEVVHYVSVGIFIESFKFLSSNTVGISGYVWQKFTDSQLKTLTPGLVFPEATKMQIHPAYKTKANGITTIGWYFEGDFTKNFDYKKYPLDHKVIGLRIWPSDFNFDIILIPDFNAYSSINTKHKFGIDNDIVFQGFLYLKLFSATK